VPNITNIQAVTFCNQQVRPMADTMAQLYFTAKSIVAFWNANSMSALIPNTTDVVIDGAATDGRQLLTAQAATAIITEAQAVIAHYEATANAVLNQVKQVSVNGGTKF
jgi:hypothetical protein